MYWACHSVRSTCHTCDQAWAIDSSTITECCAGAWSWISYLRLSTGFQACAKLGKLTRTGLKAVTGCHQNHLASGRIHLQTVVGGLTSSFSLQSGEVPSHFSATSQSPAAGLQARQQERTTQHKHHTLQSLIKLVLLIPGATPYHAPGIPLLPPPPPCDGPPADISLGP